ncbi:MAG TPA: GH3 auxin-responsive promoter family protein [Dehalococcoidia bacterium]|nr:GH3 auxin-responsive promoter family protein [Dehalococcoidia bacterium]
MGKFSFLNKDILFERKDDQKLWLKYCGFLDLYIEEFMTIQKTLLSDEIELIQKSELGKKIIGSRKIENLDDFRKNVPFTTYSDYQPYFDNKDETVLPEKPVIWARTSGHSGVIKWMPYTQENIRVLADNTLSAFILSSANNRGEVKLRPGAKVVLNLPPIPYITGVMGYAAEERLLYHPIPPLDKAEQMEFQERIEQGLNSALRSGVDYAASMAVVLNKIGMSFGELGNDSRVSQKTLHPLATIRLLQALIKARIANRPIIPKDIWQIKGLICSGTDTLIYQDEITNNWGIKPLDVYVAAETCFIAMQSWNKKGMTLVPYSNFYEFIPEEESIRSRRNGNLKPRTVLADELEVDNIYEIVITNFHGGSLIRYRIGDLIKVISIGDEETGSTLPQIVFQSRDDDIIDVSGFVRLNETEIWHAIKNTSLPYEDWTVRKENANHIPVLHIYLELTTNQYDEEMVASLISNQLIDTRKDYQDSKELLGFIPIKVTLLKQGTFHEYARIKQSEGFDIIHLKPNHINPSETVLNALLEISASL